MGFLTGSSGPGEFAHLPGAQFADRSRGIPLPRSECGSQREGLLGPIRRSCWSRNGGFAQS